ncbi:MAG: hypothetical protein SOR58_01860 [Megasphaera massiliensis]|uniref:hypothetical protein n=1 Tax=Megasphaera massiliensis TaxID=1232428 RepID=UPI002A75B6E9|nr:hypothetical protein [Megasphaera massiliensis]MDY2964927.1 hypothetical protein [Megasphaera massiliensis]
MKQKKVGKTFIKHIPYIETVIFSAGSYFSGHEVTTVRFRDDKAIYTKKRRPFPNDNDGIPREKMSKAEFLEKIEALHIEDWETAYESYANDGEQWELSIRFSNNHKALEIYGNDAFPENFKQLQQLMNSPFAEESE